MMVNRGLGSPSQRGGPGKLLMSPSGRDREFKLTLLVYDAGGVGSVAYSDLEVEGGENRFVETEGLPRDSRRIDTTWLHPNKKGGPDRRLPTTVSFR